MNLLTLLDKWEWQAKEYLTGAVDFQKSDNERILKLIAIVRAKDNSMKWIMPKVHQGNHEGEFENCQKATCVEYRKALALTDSLGEE